MTDRKPNRWWHHALIWFVLAPIATWAIIALVLWAAFS
jgi:hypothetical protein